MGQQRGATTARRAHTLAARVPAATTKRTNVLVALVLSATVAITVAGCGSPAPPSGGASSGTGAGTTAAPSARPSAAVSTVTASVAKFRLPVTLSRAVAMPGAAGHLLVLTGLHDGDRSTDAVLDVDPATNTVRVAARLPVAVHDAAGARLGGVPTVFGGGSSGSVATIQQDGGAGPARAGALAVPTSDAAAVTTASGVVLVGGYDGTRTLGQVLLITGPGQVRTLGALPTPVRYPAVAVVGSGAGQRVLVIGGESGGAATDVVQQIDPATGAVSVVGRLPAPRTQASALVLGGRLFVFGGAHSGVTGARVFADVLRWEPARRGFVPAGRLPYPVADAAATTLDGRTGYLIGGESPARVASTIIVTAR